MMLNLKDLVIEKKDNGVEWIKLEKNKAEQIAVKLLDEVVMVDAAEAQAGMEQMSEEFKKHGAELYLAPTHEAVNQPATAETTE